MFQIHQNISFFHFKKTGFSLIFVVDKAKVEFVKTNQFMYVVNLISSGIHTNYAVVISEKFKVNLSASANDLV